MRAAQRVNHRWRDFRVSRTAAVHAPLHDTDDAANRPSGLAIRARALPEHVRSARRRGRQHLRRRRDWRSPGALPHRRHWSRRLRSVRAATLSHQGSRTLAPPASMQAGRFASAQRCLTSDGPGKCSCTTTQSCRRPAVRVVELEETRLPRLVTRICRTTALLAVAGREYAFVHLCLRNVGARAVGRRLSEKFRFDSGARRSAHGVISFSLGAGRRCWVIVVPRSPGLPPGKPTAPFIRALTVDCGS